MASKRSTPDRGRVKAGCQTSITTTAPYGAEQRRSERMTSNCVADVHMSWSDPQPESVELLLLSVPVTPTSKPADRLQVHSSNKKKHRFVSDLAEVQDNL